MRVYFISGLAADKRVFKYIRVPDGYEIVHLDWIDPLPNETLSAYSSRLAGNIDQTEPFAVLGLSMGGMIAVEIASQLQPAHIIIVSSVPSSAQLPVYFKWIGKFNIHRLVPISLVKSASLMKRLFTAESREDKEVLKQIIRESDTKFIRWAINAILKWDTKNLASPVIHIHGSKDELLPIRFVKPTHAIKGGGHLMVLNHFNQINAILNELPRISEEITGNNQSQL